MHAHIPSRDPNLTERCEPSTSMARMLFTVCSLQNKSTCRTALPPTFLLGPTIATTRCRILLWCDTEIRSPNHRTIRQCGDRRNTKSIVTVDHINHNKEREHQPTAQSDRKVRTSRQRGGDTTATTCGPRPHRQSQSCRSKTFVSKVDTIQTHVHAILGQTVHQHFTEELHSIIVDPLDSTR